MKTRILKTIALATGALGCSLALLLVLRPAPQPQTPFAALANVSVLELPQAAARLVASAPAAQRAALAREVVQAVTALAKPGAIPFAVSAICKAAPDVAAETAGAAALHAPAEILPVAKAALAAAPESVEAIVSTLCRRSPRSFAAVAIVASQEAPSATDRILRSVSQAVPEVASSLELARRDAGSQSMVQLMWKAIELAAQDARRAVAAGRPADAQTLAQARDAGVKSEPVAPATLASAPTAFSATARTVTGVGAAESAKTVAAAAGEATTETNPTLDLATDLMLAKAQALVAMGPQAAMLLLPPRVEPPVTPWNPVNSREIRVADTTVVTPGSARDYSAP